MSAAGCLRTALSGNYVSSVMVSWMYNNAKDVKTVINNTLRVPLALLVKLENNNEKDAKDAMAQRTKVSRCISPGFSIVPLRNTASQTPSPGLPAPVRGSLHQKMIRWSRCAPKSGFLCLPLQLNTFRFIEKFKYYYLHLYNQTGKLIDQSEQRKGSV